AEYSLQPSRLLTPKVHKPKAKVIGPNVILDAERCILCTRCVRFCEEIAKTPELTIVQRGEHSEIDTFPGKELKNPYSLNTVDICPVGALTSRDFRFKCRVWWLKGTASVCAECSRGCSVRIDTRGEEWRQTFKPHDISSKVVSESQEQTRNKVMRLVPRYNPNVNGWWMCDEGRLAYHRFEAGRTERVIVRNGAGSPDLGYVEAVEILVKKLKEAASNPDSVAALLSPFSTNEELYLTIKFLKDVVGLKKIFLGGRGSGFEDDILIKADKNPNRKGAELILGHFGMNSGNAEKLIENLKTGKISTLLVFGDSHEKEEEISRQIQPSIFTAGFSPLKNRFTERADILFPTLTPYGKDGTFVNFDGVIQRVRGAIKPGEEFRSEWEIVRDVASKMKVEYPFDSAEEIFAEMAQTVGRLNGLDYKKIGDLGEKIL
ncbi:MAG: molybdopterin-dependent oxidoreductase, partial [Deltaproteobacteria bacterium]|nr:molybdopterin-dependent oxidoreductase [Deltaproteobacteria bacterium]